MKRVVLNKTRIVADAATKNVKLAAIHWSFEVTFFKTEMNPKSKIATIYLDDLNEKSKIQATLLSYEFWLSKIGGNSQVLEAITANKE